MSDGGAGAIVEAVSLLARSRAGRVVLVLGAAYLGLQYAVSQLSRAALAAIGILLAALVALAVAFFVRRRKRQSRARLGQVLALVALAIVGAAAALIVVLRRRKRSALAAPPSAEDIERAVAREAHS